MYANLKILCGVKKVLRHTDKSYSSFSYPKEFEKLEHPTYYNPTTLFHFSLPEVSHYLGGSAPDLTPENIQPLKCSTG